MFEGAFIIWGLMIMKTTGIDDDEDDDDLSSHTSPDLRYLVRTSTLNPINPSRICGIWGAGLRSRIAVYRKCGFGFGGSGMTGEHKKGFLDHHLTLLIVCHRSIVGAGCMCSVGGSLLISQDVHTTL